VLNEALSRRASAKRSQRLEAGEKVPVPEVSGHAKDIWKFKARHRQRVTGRDLRHAVVWYYFFMQNLSKCRGEASRAAFFGLMRVVQLWFSSCGHS
jgi:hypothetical protein